MKTEEKRKVDSQIRMCLCIIRRKGCGEGKAAESCEEGKAVCCSNMAFFGMGTYQGHPKT